MIKDVPPKETFAENTPEAIIGTIATINKPAAPIKII